MNPPALPRGRAIELSCWLLVVAAGVWLRFWQIDLLLLIDDEWHAIHRLMQAGYAEIVQSMGHADYSVPLTLLFRLLADTVGLNDFALRFLPMLFGLAGIVAIPLLLSPWLDRRQRLVLAALIAVSPLLVHFSRYVRPYSPMVFLGFTSIILLWRWWHEGGRWKASISAISGILAIWLHALTALFVGAALVWLTVAAGLRWRRGHGSRDLWRILAVGSLVTLGSAALVLPPLLGHPEAIAVKAGRDVYSGETLIRAWEMVLGVGSPWLAVALAVPVVYGGFELGRRAPAFLAIWLWMLAASLIVIQLLGPEWVQNALVLVRYCAVAQPFILALLALGVVGLADRLAALAAGGKRPWIGALAGLVIVPALYLLGPLPKVYSGINQFTNSVRYQVDYDFERSVFNDLFGPLELPEAYRRMMRAPGDWTIIEAGWHFESHHTPVSEYQRHHQMPIRIGMLSGLCTDWTWGELDPEAELSISLSRFVALDTVLDDPPDGHFVVFHRDSPLEQVRPLPDIEPCIQAFRQRFGDPWYSSEGIVVFRLPGRDRAGGS
jgi:hypothetical protein